jgi:exosortase/archaeosortase family protein
LQDADVKTKIRLLDSVILFSHKLRRDSALQWFLLAVLQATLSVWLVQATQQDQGITLLAVVIWGGAAICIEDQLEHFQVRPSGASMLAGLALLAYATWRSCLVLGLDSMVYVLPVLQGVGLILMVRPVRQLLSLKPALLVLSLFPLQFLVFKLLPEYWLSVTTGKLSQLILMIFGVNASAVGRLLATGPSGVSIEPSCSGAGQIAQLAVIAIVFCMAYPIKSVSGRIAFLAFAPLLGYVVNAFRISLLALIIGSSLPQKDWLFDFFHDEWGGLVFSGVATIILGQIYMMMVERQITSNHV